jgi:acetyltransferase-like isoleucine patch superfamily enzyme
MITTDIQIGRHDQVYIGATIGYDAVLEDLVTLNPSVNVFGNVKFEEGVETGTSSVLLPRCEMGCGVIIEAGSVVTKSLSPNVMAVGAPVKAIKELTQDWHKGPDA